MLRIYRARGFSKWRAVVADLMKLTPLESAIRRMQHIGLAKAWQPWMSMTRCQRTIHVWVNDLSTCIEKLRMLLDRDFTSPSVTKGLLQDSLNLKAKLKAEVIVLQRK